MTGRQAWTRRLTIASYAIHIFALVTAVIASGIPNGFDASAIIGAAIASVGVAVSFLARLPFPTRSTREVVVLATCVSTYSIACGLTGGFASAFAILPVATIFLAAIGAGMTAALPTALLSILGVTVASMAGGDAELTGSTIRISAFYLLTALAFGEVRRALFEQTTNPDAVAAADASETRLASLETTHELLEGLVRVATSPDINAVASAQDAIRDAQLIAPSDAAILRTRNGTVLARRGDPNTATPTTVIMTGGEDLGIELTLWPSSGAITDDQREMLADALTPVQLAIENDEMVSTLAGVAVQRERVRLARELHDDVAPSVASVGLTLDMLIASGQLDSEQQRNIEATRTNVTRLVDRIRAQVQDLRADRSGSLTEHAHSLVAEVDADGPSVIVSLDERVPPRPAVADELRSMITEAFRNAINHAEATSIRIEGSIDEDGGTVRVIDNGRGFDTTTQPTGHFGIPGMQERAGLIGATIDVTSKISDGTIVAINWRYPV